MKRLSTKQAKIRIFTANFLERVEKAAEEGVYSQEEVNYIHSKMYEVSDQLEDWLAGPQLEDGAST